ncbi:hypothetical protein N8Z38_06090 [Amylibacter sp.]|nr:hypothetical protein [Amylibacter sp.]
MRPILKANKIKYIISVLVFFPLSTASANTICDINTKTVLKWPGYASKQNVWFDKGDSFFKFSSTIKSKSMRISKHFNVIKESCEKSTIVVTNNTDNKNSNSNSNFGSTDTNGQTETENKYEYPEIDFDSDNEEYEFAM